MALLPKIAAILRRFFKPVGRDVISNPNKSVLGNFRVGKGSLVTFNYTFWRNDAYPLVVVSDNDLARGKLWGVNLHYLTFPYVKGLLAMSSGNPNFSYASISGDEYLKKSFRSYKWSGIRQVKVLDPSFLLNTMQMVRSFDPAEVQIIRRNVQEQIRTQINPKASQVTNLNSPGNDLGGTGG
jgi:hypothetical protein